MHRLKAILTIIRFPNLVFIMLTQFLCYYFIVREGVHTASFSTLSLILFVTATTLIAAAGYIINDYFDMGTDHINRPERVTIERTFKRRHVIAAHIGLNCIALLISAYIAIRHVQLRFISWQILSIFLLIVYSTTFKRKLLIGNIIIGILTSLTLFTVAVYEPTFDLWTPSQHRAKLLWVYIIFAFLITLIREIIKDTEDIKGDAAEGCQTLPLVWGIDKAKQIVWGLCTVLILFLIGVSITFWKSNIALSLYMILLVGVPLILVMKMLKSAATSQDFRRLSSYSKWITLLGITSMLLL